MATDKLSGSLHIALIFYVGKANTFITIDAAPWFNGSKKKKKKKIEVANSKITETKLLVKDICE